MHHFNETETQWTYRGHGPFIFVGQDENEWVGGIVNNIFIFYLGSPKVGGAGDGKHKNNTATLMNINLKCNIIVGAYFVEAYYNRV